MIIGTAGHIDHGKTALVRALTGVDTDRLKEEKARGISIDLGFAYLPAGDGGILGFVDVPGHEKFLRNMLAGATGIDFVLLVVAADDGIMPQTHEHLAIVDLLGLTRGLVALTKIDLVSPERCAEVAQDVREMLQTTGLASAQVVPVSANSGEGIGELRNRLQAAARDAAQRSALGRFRLAVDRCFSLTGVGTIVTGAVLSGAVAVGDTVVVSPGGVNTNIHESVLSRQGRYGQTGYYGADPEVFKRLKSVIEGGIDPVDLARIVLAAIRRNEFWILPYPEFIPMIEKYNAQVIAALRQYENDPDYLRRKKSGRGMPGATQD
jgi:selenocysteine-specific elongation factor